MAEGATAAEFWFDPGCPHTWRTSRWLADVASRGHADVQWRLMSLTVLNEGQDKPADYWERRRQADLALRVLAAAQASGGTAAVGALYAALGRRRHDEGRAYSAEVVQEAVAEVGLPADVAAAVDNANACGERIVTPRRWTSTSIRCRLSSESPGFCSTPST